MSVNREKILGLMACSKLNVLYFTPYWARCALRALPEGQRTPGNNFLTDPRPLSGGYGVPGGPGYPERVLAPVPQREAFHLRNIQTQHAAHPWQRKVSLSVSQLEIGQGPRKL